MVYKPKRAELRAFFYISLPNNYEDPKSGYTHYKDHFTVHDLSCASATRYDRKGIEIELKFILKGPAYLKKRFMLEVEHPIKYCNRCLKNNPYAAITPGANLTDDFDEDLFIDIIARGKGKEANQWSTVRPPIRKRDTDGL